MAKLDAVRVLRLDRLVKSMRPKPISDVELMARYSRVVAAEGLDGISA